MTKLVVSTIKAITSGRVENDDNVRVETWECLAELEEISGGFTQVVSVSGILCVTSSC